MLGKSGVGVPVKYMARLKRRNRFVCSPCSSGKVELFMMASQQMISELAAPGETH